MYNKGPLTAFNCALGSKNADPIAGIIELNLQEVHDLQGTGVVLRTQQMSPTPITSLNTFQCGLPCGQAT